MKQFLLLFICINIFKLQAIENLNCIILLDKNDTESIGCVGRFYLMSKLQSALAEQASPLLVHTSLWNSFIERRIRFEQRTQLADTKEQKTLTLYNKIKEQILYLSNHYNSTSNDITQNKSLIAHCLNEEFYNNKDALSISDLEYQLFLSYITPFNPIDWSIYKKNGFYLLLPKNIYPNIPLRVLR